MAYKTLKELTAEDIVGGREGFRKASCRIYTLSRTDKFGGTLYKNYNLEVVVNPILTINFRLDQALFETIKFKFGFSGNYASYRFQGYVRVLKGVRKNDQSVFHAVEVVPVPEVADKVHFRTYLDSHQENFCVIDPDFEKNLLPVDIGQADEDESDVVAQGVGE